MEDLIMQYVMPVSCVIALAICYVVKTAARSEKLDRFIPLIAAIIGLVVCLWVGGWQPTPELVAQGLISGLAATGLYELFKNFIEGMSGTNAPNVEAELLREQAENGGATGDGPDDEISDEEVTEDVDPEEQADG